MSDENEHEHHQPFSFIFGGPSAEQIEQARMERDANSHETKQFFDSLDETQLRRLFGLITYVVQSEGMAGAYYQGIIGMILDQKFGVCLACAKKHDEELAKMSGQPVPEPRKEDPDELVMGTKRYDELMYLYGMEQDDDGSEHVMCKNCKKWYQNLADRILRPPGKPGCDGCIEKERWG